MQANARKCKPTRNPFFGRQMTQIADQFRAGQIWRGAQKGKCGVADAIGIKTQFSRSVYRGFTLIYRRSPVYRRATSVEDSGSRITCHARGMGEGAPLAGSSQAIIPSWPAMAKYTSLPLESHKNRSLFLKHARDIGKAYKNQALELISICQLLSRIASPKCVHEDAELRR
jgi:hypothetical protein